MKKIITDVVDKLKIKMACINYQDNLHWHYTKSSSISVKANKSLGIKIHNIHK